jgi:amino acid transporter
MNGGTTTTGTHPATRATSAGPSPARFELASERLSATMLPRVLTSTDLAVILVAITLFISNGAAIQPAGPAAFGWWLLAFALFFVPGAIATQRLAKILPGEGSIYLWTHHAFGSFWGFFAGFCSWWPGLLAVVSLGPVALGFLGYLLPDSVGSASVEMQGLGVVAITLISGAIATLRLRTVQTAVNLSMVVYGAAVLVVVAAGVVHLAGGHHAAVNPADLGAYASSSPHGLNTGNWTFFGLAVLALLGVEVPLNLGAEIRTSTSSGRFLIWGCTAVMVTYLAVTWAVMVTVPQADATASAITPIPAAVTIAFGPAAGKTVALILAACTVMMGAVYQYAFSRLLFVSALDRTLPVAMARLNRFRVPSTAVWAQSLIISAVVTLAFVVLPVLGYGGSPADIETKAYDVLQASVAVVWCLSIVFLFLDTMVLSRRETAAVGTRQAWWLWPISVVGILSSMVAVVATVSGSWTPLITNRASFHVLGATVQWGDWSWAILVMALVSLLAGGGLYLFGQRIRRRADARLRVGPASSQA